jgi:phage tail sheath protein FI
MASFKTPGVYIKEISTLPASVAPVATAIPGFVGYTKQQAVVDGEVQDHNTPVRIESLLDFESAFGGPFTELFTVTLEDTAPEIAVSTPSGLSPYLLYYHLRMYFENGGGPCHVISVGTYVDPDPSVNDIDEAELLAGLAACEEIDEITLLVVPEAILLDANGRQNINDAMLAQCNKLQDRFAIMDAFTDPAETVFDDGNNFRDDVGSDFLKYGAAYYPSLKTTLELFYEETGVTIVDNRTNPSTSFDTLSLENILNGDGVPVAATGTITVDDNTLLENDIVTINGQDFVESSGDPTTGWDRGATPIQAATSLTTALNNFGDSAYTFLRTSNVITITAAATGPSGNDIDMSYTDSGSGSGITLSGPTLSGGVTESTDKDLYNQIVDELEQNLQITLYPSAAIAGIYARTDRNRGVWKAPANTSLRLVEEPTKLVTAEQQESLNVDADTGKSINVIRKFAKKGNLVWGARTLAGNDNEWRYVPVRRLFIFMEESIQKATEPSVFEPNDAKTWTKLKVMIENFLSKLWREGALAGAKPEDAFFVNVGLGKTMTALDILEGRLIIEVGVAAVRPAEFIILKFMHKLQES